MPCPRWYDGRMKMYQQVSRAVFLERRSRFTALVEQEGRVFEAHINNTGRLKELLLPGARVVLSGAARPARQTAHDLVAVYRGEELVNVDSLAPNRAALPWLAEQYPGARVRPEARFLDSWLDAHLAMEGLSLYVEVKGCTLVLDGLALFPDAPTQRGARHLRALAAAVAAGHRALALFVVQTEKARAFAPHSAMDPAFAEALARAAEKGVMVQAVSCAVAETGIRILGRLPVILRGNQV